MFDDKTIARSHDGRVWGVDIPAMDERTPEEWAQVFPAVPKLELLFATTQLRHVYALTTVTASSKCALHWISLKSDEIVAMDYYFDSNKREPCWNVYAYMEGRGDVR